MDGYDKWNRYKIGDITWIKGKDRPHRKVFVDMVLKADDIVSVIEVGPGEMLEYQMLKDKKAGLRYAVVDVSDLFLRNCAEQYPDVVRYQVPMEEMSTVVPGDFDMVYVSSVIEHTNDIHKCLKNIIGAAKNFYFSLFKWSHDGDLVPQFNSKKEYWSTSFNIHDLLEAIRQYGDIDFMNILIPSGEFVPFDVCCKEASGHQRGCLVIRGKRKVC